MTTVIIMRCEKCQVEQDFARETADKQYVVLAPKHEQVEFLNQHAGHVTSLTLTFEKRDGFPRHQKE